MSSLTFKHLFPDFGAALENIAAPLDGDRWIFFDLIESTLVDRSSPQYPLSAQRDDLPPRYVRAP